jgi:hypothetical protein
MNRKLCILILALSLLLAGCGRETPQANWDESWTVIAPFLAAEPMEGFTFGESDDIMGIGGVYYAAWTNGEARDFTNAQGENTMIFNSLIYVVAQECRTEADAETALSQWLTREKQSYACGEAYELTYGSRVYTILPMLSGSEGNPYGFGCAAFTAHGTNAICVELVCSDTFTGSPQAVLEEFLSGLHYNE